MILFLVGASGVHIGCCLNWLEVSFLLFRFVWWLNCLLLKEFFSRPTPDGSRQVVYQAGKTCKKNSVHRSAIRSNASSKFLQNYAGRRVRQPRTPNTSAARVVTNLIKLKHWRVKKTGSPSTPTCWRRTPSCRSRRNTISHRETQTQQTKQDKERTGKEENMFPLSVCLMSS